MRQGFATFKKETRMAPGILDRRIYPNFLSSYFKTVQKETPKARYPNDDFFKKLSYYDIILIRL